MRSLNEESVEKDIRIAGEHSRRGKGKNGDLSDSSGAIAVMRAMVRVISYTWEEITR